MLHTSPVAPNAPLPPFDIKADQETGSPGAHAFSAKGHVVVLGGREFELRADSITGNMQTGIFSASGNVYLREIDTSFTASQLTYNRDAGLGVLDRATLDFPPFMVMARQIELRPNLLIATDAVLSTCPPGKNPDFHVAAQQIRVDPIKRRVDVSNAALFIGRTRIIKFRHLTHKTQQNATQSNTSQELKTSFGYDGHRGPYLVLGRNVNSANLPLNLAVLIPIKRDWSASASTSTTILLKKGSGGTQDQIDRMTDHSSIVSVIRDFASYPGPPLPPSDPLLYHDFLGSNPLESVFNRPVVPALVPSATISYQEPVYGRRIGELSYSRYPEVAVRIDLPLLGNGNLPVFRDPVAMRQALRKPYVFTYASFSTGYYEEQPTGAKSDRSGLSLNLDMRPLLIGPNTLFRPRIGFYEAHYLTVHSQYGFQQIDLAIQRSFDDRTAIGAEFIGTSQHGHDPFVFDSVDTSSEVDLRAQFSSGRAIIGGRVKTDLRKERPYDVQIDYSMPQRCYIPTITYDSASHAIGFGINIPGVTF